VDGGSDAGASYSYPKGFLFGSATAAFQVEKGLTASDWSGWASTKGKIVGDGHPDTGGPDALAHVDEDVKLLVDSKQNAYRFSIEWSRLYPTRAAFDRDEPVVEALAAYDGLIGKLVAAKIAPVVTLVHFSMPSWLSDPTRPNEPQGFERTEASTLFAEFARRAAARWGKNVDAWITINEPLNVALGGYVQGSLPPGVLLDVPRALALVKAEARAHAQAFDAIHQADTGDADGDGKAAMVSVALHQRTFRALDPNESVDVEAADRVRRLWNLWFANAIVRGDFDDEFDLSYDGPNDKRADPALVKRADFLGVNYYSDTLVSATRGIILPVINAAIYQANLETDRPKTDFGWDIHPDGLGVVLDELAPYGLPLIITENGLADASDNNRARFLAEHLVQVGKALQRGVDVRGYMHWALIDNFEWASGFCPKFGFASYNSSGVRTARPSLDVYRSIIEANGLAETRVASMPGYKSATEFCR
jgi:beta-glucosidase/6-phospho-beta-glucosidase/beta-galactosidase